MEDISISAEEKEDEFSMSADNSYNADDVMDEEDKIDVDDDDDDDAFFTNLLIQRIQTNDPPQVEYDFSLDDKDDIDLVILAKMLKTNTFTTTLNLFCDTEICRVTIHGWEAIFEMLQINKIIQELQINLSTFDLECTQLFTAMVLPNNNTLKHITFSGLCLNGASAIVDAICANPNGCTEKYLCFNFMKDDDISNIELQKQLAYKFVTLLQHKRIILKQLDLMENKLGDEFVTILANGLKTNTQLEFLDLRSNNISKIGAQSLANALYYNRTLLNLYLSDNAIGDEGTNLISRALRYHPMLKVLNMCDITMSDEGILQASKLLFYNESIQEFLYLDDCDPVDILSQVLSIIDYNDTVKSVYETDEQAIDEMDDEEALAYARFNALLEKNRSGDHTAPKKGVRRRQDISMWLYSDWIWMNSKNECIQTNN